MKGARTMSKNKEVKTRVAVVLLLSGIIFIMNTSGISYIYVGKHVYLDLSMIPAAVVIMLLRFPPVLLFGLYWGALSCFTHPDIAYITNSYMILSYIVYCLALEGAQIFADKYSSKNFNGYYIVFFAILVHTIVFDFGMYMWMSSEYHITVPYHEILVKIGLTILFFCISISLVIKQLNQFAAQKHQEEK